MRFPLYILLMSFMIVSWGCRSGNSPTTTFATSCRGVPKESVQKALSALKNIPTSYLYTAVEGSNSGAKAKAFVREICAEFADDSNQVGKRLELLARISHVKGDKMRPYDPTVSPWQQLTVGGFRDFAFFSRELFDFGSKQKKGSSTNETNALSVCETKFIFKDYLAHSRGLKTQKDYEAYLAAREAFLYQQKTTNGCSQEDYENVYLFRGVKSISPTSPESPLLGQVGTALRNNCNSRTEPNDSEICRSYKVHPLQTRIKIASEVSSRYFALSDSEERNLQDWRYPFVVAEDRNGDGIGESIVPTSFNVRDLNGLAKDLTLLYRYVIRKDIVAERKLRSRIITALDEIFSGEQATGMELSQSTFSQTNDIRKLSESSTGRMKLNSLLSVILFRHANYLLNYLYLPCIRYLGTSATIFQSNSADFSQALKFAVRSKSSTRIFQRSELYGGWMYVFKVKKNNLYSRNSILRKEMFEPYQAWIDEASFSKHPYSQEEKSFDRVNAPDHEELSDILFLGDVNYSAEVAPLLNAIAPQVASSSEYTISELPTIE